MENIYPGNLRTDRWDFSDPKSVHIRVKALMLWEKEFSHQEGWIGSVPRIRSTELKKLDHCAAITGIASGVSAVPLSPHDANRDRSFSQ